MHRNCEKRHTKLDLKNSRGKYDTVDLNCIVLFNAWLHYWILHILFQLACLI